VRRRKVISVVVLVLGVVLLVGALVDHSFAAPRNAECQSGLGQIGQLIDNSVAHDCGLVGVLEAAFGWLLLLGLATLGAGAYLVGTYSKSARSSSDRTPPDGGSPSRTI
jgi:hypothetical protein